MTQLIDRPVAPSRESGALWSGILRIWHKPAARATVSYLVAGLSALAMAAAMPRGPVTGADVVVAMLGCAATGLVAGLVMRSRWAILAAPAAFVVVFELARINVIGPSVDRPRFDLTLGVIVFILGRGFSAFVMLVPMALGGAYGAAIARRLHGGQRARSRGWLPIARRLAAGLIAVALISLAILLTRPGSTPPILGADGRPLPGSVAELAKIRLGGHDQTVLIRGRSTTNPVLLYLAGGPGQSDIGYTRAYMPTMENDFVFAVWDQRGTGKSYAALDPTDTWTLEQAVSDTIELTNYLRERYHKEKIYLFGNSWGSTLGVLAVQRAPELFAAYIGAGQMVSELATDKLIYQDVLDYASRTHDTGLADRMREWGQPPYQDIYAYGFLIGYYDKIGPYDKTRYFTDHGPSGIDGNGAPEYGPLDKVNKLKAIFDMGSVMYPQLQGLDFRQDVPSLDVPVYLVMGTHELAARAGIAREWFDQLQAPSKQWITFPDSGHIPQFEEFSRFQAFMTGTVLPATGG
jgi:pimeloyl-ACP methyl ester carboxylesterase